MLHTKTYERAVRLHNRAAQCQAAGEPKRPEKLYLRSLAFKEQIFGPDHLEIGLTHNNLGLFYKSVGQFPQARTSYLRALSIFEAVFGASHENVADVLYNLAQLSKKESEAYEARIQLIQQEASELADPSRGERAVVDRKRARYALAIAPSRIHRFGVFAGETIPSGSRVIEYTGERVSRREWLKRTADRCYLLRVDKYWCIDGSVGGSGAERINHSCEPNCRFIRIGQRMWVTSLRAIAAGEELVIDYKFPKDAKLTPCYCGAAICRGRLNIE